MGGIRSFLAQFMDDAGVLAAVGYNFRLLLRWLVRVGCPPPTLDG
jgi:hypothetical protein